MTLTVELLSPNQFLPFSYISHLYKNRKLNITIWKPFFHFFPIFSNSDLDLWPINLKINIFLFLSYILHLYKIHSNQARDTQVSLQKPIVLDMRTERWKVDRQINYYMVPKFILEGMDFRCYICPNNYKHNIIQTWCVALCNIFGKSCYPVHALAKINLESFSFFTCQPNINPLGTCLLKATWEVAA